MMKKSILRAISGMLVVAVALVGVVTEQSVHPKVAGASTYNCPPAPNGPHGDRGAPCYQNIDNSTYSAAAYVCYRSGAELFWGEEYRGVLWPTYAACMDDYIALAQPYANAKARAYHTGDLYIYMSGNFAFWQRLAATATLMLAYMNATGGILADYYINWGCAIAGYGVGLTAGEVIGEASGIGCGYGVEIWKLSHGG